MKAPAKLVLIALFSFLVPFVTFAAANDVMVVVNGNTEVNREAYNYIRKTFQFNNINYTVTATLNPTTVKAGQYKTVVVLNTGTASGLDPVLQKFIDGYGDKKGLYLVNLYKSKGDLTVTTFSAASSPEGVDGVTAASTWRGFFGNSNGGDPQQMHLAWVKALVKFLGRA
jgi:hypothetical protein